ncbi:YvcK family protein [Candidatus Gracilibacteria bacterium]|nr:MAG: YvcK family protein [Candidatus Gracilibacteria bacterium]
MKITTIGGGNGQSNLLDGLNKKFGDKIEISSIVSMSDDGRTTGELMKAFNNELGLHLPPPGDLRRCLFSLSESKYKSYFKLVFEYTFLNEEKISNFTIFDLFLQVHKEILFFGKETEFKDDLVNFVENQSGELFDYLSKKAKDIFEFKLPLKSTLKGHKFGNILMASLYYNFDKDYDKMLDFMHRLLKVNASVIPVTTKKAFIRAVLGNGEIVETQDKISNEANYSSGIADLELMDSSVDAVHHKKVSKAVEKADFIIIGPGDLFTSIISNFIISGVQKSIKETDAKIIYIGNNTNKGGETMGLTQLDFVNKIERFLGRRIDYFIANNKKPILSQAELESFKSDISVKGGDYIFVSNGERKELERRKIKLIEADLLDDESFYKHSKQKLLNVLEHLFFGE